MSLIPESSATPALTLGQCCHLILVSTLSNYQLDGVTPVGSDTASFTLNVLCEFTGIFTLMNVVIWENVLTQKGWGRTGWRWFRDSGSVGGRDSHSSVWY